jgi:hypothetical protein
MATYIRRREFVVTLGSAAAAFKKSWRKQELIRRVRAAISSGVIKAPA